MSEPFFPVPDVQNVTYDMRERNCRIQFKLARDPNKGQPAVCHVTAYAISKFGGELKLFEDWPLDDARAFARALYALLHHACDNIREFHHDPVFGTLRRAEHHSHPNQIGEIMCDLASLCPPDAAKDAIGLLAAQRLKGSKP